MITYVKSTEAKLFEDAAHILGREPFDSVAEYLHSLSALKLRSPKYVRLPLYEDGHEDEEIFEINANERLIKVPASFNKNGVGIVSDELAETLWFKINRYFDIKDFGEAVDVTSDELKDGELHILIQWEAPDGAKGASWAYAIDADTDPDFIYFGWALTAEHLMSQAGKIKFAVRILQYDGDAVAYSFGTQAAQVTVKPSLSFDVTKTDIEIESVADKIASRFMEGPIAYSPVFSTNLPPYMLNLTGTAADTLTVEADAPEGEEYDAIIYKWYKKGPDDECFELIDNAWTPSLAITSSGQYYVVVFGMREIVDAEEHIYDPATGTASADPVKFRYHSSVAKSQSTICEIPAPIALKFIEPFMADHLVITQTASDIHIMVERQEIKDPSTEVITVVGAIDLKVEKTNSAALLTDEAIAALTDADFTEVDLTAVDAPISFEVDAGNAEHIIVHMADADEGYYRFTVINKLNGDEKSITSNKLCRVLEPATIVPYDENVENCTKAILWNANKTPKNEPEGSFGAGDKIFANVEIDGLSDEIEIKWYQVAGQGQDPGAGTESDDVYLGNTLGNVLSPLSHGTFYFIAINHVAESSAEAKSNPITINL